MKSFNSYDRFDLEQDILRVWGVSDLIEEFLRQYLDGSSPLTEDEVFNKLNGIKEVLNMSNQRLWDGFERMVATKQFVKNKESKNG